LEVFYKLSLTPWTDLLSPTNFIKYEHLIEYYTENGGG